MNNTINLGNSLQRILKESVKNFTIWTSVMTEILKNRDELKNNINGIKEFDSALTNLKQLSEEVVKVAEEIEK